MKPENNKLLTFIRTHFSVGKLFLLGFVIFIICLDDYSCVQRVKNDKEINNLRQQIKGLNDTTELYNQRAKELKHDKELIEQIAREEYLMKKPNEEIYIIETEK